MSQELEERVVDLEIQITHQANVIDDLSEMVGKQWAMIDRFTRQIKLLQDAVLELEEAGEAPKANQKPPHY